MQPVCDNESPCKCCHASSRLFGVADFSKNCISAPLPVSGIPVYYYRCPDCGLIFTTFFDTFTQAELKRVIYNERYVDVDPDFSEARPRQNAEIVCQMYGGNREIGILDYGGGSGLLAGMLHRMGFRNVDTYDPFFSETPERPTIPYDCILCLEVMEHTPRPRETFGDLFSLLRDNGILVFSTLTQPANIEEVGINWWYIGPRNGHVSIYTRESLRIVAHEAGFNFGSFDQSWHLMFRNIPKFANHLLSRLFS